MQEFDFSDIEAWGQEVTLRDGTTLLLRAQRPSDQDALWELASTFSEATLQQISYHFTYELIERWSKNINYAQNLPLVAIDPDGRIVAQVILYFSSYDELKHCGVLAIWIREAFQGRGLGTLLTKLMLQIGPEKGLKKICLETFMANKRAIHMYEKCGFKIEGLLEKEYYHYLTETYLDAYRMAIHL
jgi:RimJ/RimL family protein N-acetyltransferase